MDLVTVFRTSDPGLVAVAKSILDEAAIEYVAQGEHIQNLFPLIASGPVQFQVRFEDAPRAHELLSALDSPSR